MNNDSFNKIQLVGQKIKGEAKDLLLVKARLKSFFAAKTLQIWWVLFTSNGL